MRRIGSVVRVLFAQFVVALSTAHFASAQPHVSGQVYADALAALHGYSVPADSSAFQIRRLQLTAAQSLDSTFSVLAQLEADDAALTDNGKGATFMKQAWLRWGHVRGFGDLTLGLVPTPTWRRVEDYWGYRSIEKAAMEVQELGFSTDIGASLQREPDPAHPLGWFLMLSNDTGQRPENDPSKRLSLAVPWQIGDFVIEGLADYTGRPGPQDRWTGRLFAGWRHGANAGGMEVYEQVNASAGVGGADVRPAGLSVFGHRAITPAWNVVGRVDWTDPDLATHDAGYRQLYLIAALDATPRARVHLMPNALVRTYQGKSGSLPGRDPDVTLRVTLWFVFP